MLYHARVEKDVENVYRASISEATGAVWASPYGTDGVAHWGNVRLLFEAKYDLDFKSRPVLCGVLGQVILYLKKFEQAGEVLPNVLLVGDKNEWFVLPTSAVQAFLSLPIDWSVSPSGGCTALTAALVSGINILPFVHDVIDQFDVASLIRKIESVASGEQGFVRASTKNLDTIFNYWRERVFRDTKGKQGLTPVEQVDVFLKCLFVPEDVYPHPNKAKRGVLMVPGYGERVLVNVDHYQSFFEHFQQGYKPSEIKGFLAMKDRLIEEGSRRRQGAFFTPALWVDEAHREVERVLGADWRKECIVWDPAAGTGNLTRDYHDWGQLISSTLEASDAESMKEHGWGGTAFQYDFLNPEAEGLFDRDRVNAIPPRVDRMLREAAAAGKRLVFFMNPPYGTANDAGTKGTSKAGMAITAVNAAMKDAKLGAPSQQLYAQFMFQAVELAKQYGFRNHTVALFSKPTFISSGSYKPFRDWWYGQHAYWGGFLFQASHFADVSGAWGVSFTVWNSGNRTDAKKFLPIRLTDVIDFAVATTAIKEIYNSDDRGASDWVRAPIKKLNGVDAPQMSSGLKVKGVGELKQGALCSLAIKGTSLVDAGTGTWWQSGDFTGNTGKSDVLPSNWRRAVALYGARKLVEGNWINDKDEYLVPDELAPGYEQWVNDCHVYALLHNANNCTAMRDVECKGKSWRIKNHWFWRTRENTLQMVDDRATGKIYEDCIREPINRAAGRDKPWEANGDAYLAYLFSSGKTLLSPDALRVLSLLDDVWVRSLPLRESYYMARPVSDKEPDLHLHAWDAGIYQLKHLFRDEFPEDWKTLMAAHKALAGRLQNGVYTYGFLRR